MRESTVSFRDRLKTIDKTVVFCVLGMIILSVLTIFGGYAAGGYVKFTASRVITQAFTAALGIAVMLVMSFMDYLNKNGVNATLRRELGGDISASCGQLRNGEI